ncbi:hypothetical protein AMAG_03012 [Allomyces macrogynus ATCC 38327]|uniref:Uncharacterized protein n=1 Tax=Allomyces macrogynus (strain ATCC 38327) TaxID=578462 RepID=A0A0L0S4A8_ALLM3|nr:hypothetical protein AMAG_03012 [Allomyces macrogynus ATCC 38327]|eukprot:KNE57280.1 hypothetical protein AMAG_03012 [Allomyces macrogynus ATCC 38327]
MMRSALPVRALRTAAATARNPAPRTTAVRHTFATSNDDAPSPGTQVHPLPADATGRIALSLFPKSGPAHAVVGWTRTPTSNGTDLRPADFAENPAFVAHLHKVLKDHAHEDGDLVALAKHQKIGWMHVADQRNPPPWGRIPDPDDIIGSVQLDGEGQIRAHSYQPMPTHRIVSNHGLFQLSPFLHEKLVQSFGSK